MAVTIVLGVLATLLIAAAATGVAVWQLRVVCHPGELWVFMGARKRPVYLFRAGEARLRVPFIETAECMPTTPIPFEAMVHGASTRGNVPVTLRLVGKVRVSTVSESQIQNAVQRFLGQQPAEIATVASQTLEGVVREIAASHTAEDFLDGPRMSKLILRNAQDDMSKLGLAPTDLSIERADRNG